MSISRCDRCGFEAEITSSDIKTEILDVDNVVKHHFLQCPSCGAKFTIDITDVTLRHKISNYKKIRAKYDKLNMSGNVVKAQNKLNKLRSIQEEIQKDEEALRSRYRM